LRHALHHDLLKRRGGSGQPAQVQVHRNNTSNCPRARLRSTGGKPRKPPLEASALQMQGGPFQEGKSCRVLMSIVSTLLCLGFALQRQSHCRGYSCEQPVQPKLGWSRLPPCAVISARRSVCSCVVCKTFSTVRHSAAMGGRKSNADVAAGRSALRLDQLPAEVRAGELAACLLVQGQPR
jgi:hypothetical protein